MQIDTVENLEGLKALSVRYFELLSGSPPDSSDTRIGEIRYDDSHENDIVEITLSCEFDLSSLALPCNLGNVVVESKKGQSGAVMMSPVIAYAFLAALCDTVGATHIRLSAVPGADETVAAFSINM